eukprot:754631-Rhodomonas_salina.1
MGGNWALSARRTLAKRRWHVGRNDRAKMAEGSGIGPGRGCSWRQSASRSPPPSPAHSTHASVLC